MTDNGLTTVPSRHDVKVTVDRLEAAAKAKGLTIFARSITRRAQEQSA